MPANDPSANPGSARVRLAVTCGRSSPDATAPTTSLAISVGGRTKSARGPSVAISQRTTAPASSRSGTVLEDRHDPIELALGIDETDPLGGDTQPIGCPPEAMLDRGAPRSLTLPPEFDHHDRRSDSALVAVGGDHPDVAG